MHKNVKKKINTPITHHLEITTVYIYKHSILFFFLKEILLYIPSFTCFLYITFKHFPMPLTISFQINMSWTED